MTLAQRKKRFRDDLRIAARAMTQLPQWAINLWRPFRYKVIWGGRGGTRSWSVARTLLLLAAQKKLRILCAREIQSSIRDSVHQLFRDQIELLGIAGYIVTDREIRHENGSLFLFEGLHRNITKIKSMEGIDICWVEEAERITKESWSVLIPTIRKKGSEIWITFNPDQEDDATYVRFILNTPKNCWRIKVGWKHNPWLSEELREEKDYMYAIDPEGADWVWGGNIRRISDAQILGGKYVIRSFDVPTKIDDDGQVVPAWGGPYQGQDFGFGTDPAAAIRCWVDNTEHILYIEHEGWKLHLEIDETTDHWNMAIPGFDQYVTRADSSRPDTISYLKRHGLPRIRPTKKHAGSVADGIAHLRSYRQIVVHPRCEHFALECKLYSYKVDKRSGDILPIPVDRHNHLIDSARYALDPLIKSKRYLGLDAIDLGGTDENGYRTCARCESLLPDDGICPHCGWMASDSPLAVAGLPVGTHPHHAEEVIDSLPRVDTRHVNGNGNGHTNGKNGKLNRLLDINTEG